MYMSQEMPNLRRFLARFWLSDNQMTIILESKRQILRLPLNLTPLL